MRYLSKIVFLNSAHIPYAEVKLDGNVHFIGTQGVGKSTLLRALLFFYNADKLKLGIPKEKKSFDAFYFPYGNSYIIYEVMRENGAYCVVAAKSQGRVYFRFVDAPFQRDWFIDGRNAVYAEWGRVREHIGPKIQTTAQVTSYEMYRDIIFGNNRKQEMIPFRKFAIVESAKYQNIPRTIQNVFLNSKLDADFIKDTIIRSMSDEDISVDLDFYRSQIKEFEQEYRDVMLWFEKNKNGEVPVRKMAGKVMNAYRDLIYTHKQIDEGRAELNFAEKRALHDIPQVKEDIARKETERERLLRLMGELQQKYTKERDGLITDIGVINDLLKQIRDKRLHYERLQIDEIVRRVAREEILNQELEQVRRMKSELTRAYEDVIGKYRLLSDNLEADFRTFENTQQARIFARKSEIAVKQEELMQLVRKEEEKIRTVQEEKIQTVDNRMQQLRDEQAQWNLKLQKVRYERPHQKEMEDCEEGINELRKKDKELELGIRQQQADINRLRQECEWKVKELKWEFQTKAEDIRKERRVVEEQLQVLDALIEKRKGSLCEWLEQNKPGWQETIGKVADEESVLYSHELHPQLAKEETTLFGVSLNLSVIDRSVRTPEEMKRERQIFLYGDEASGIPGCVKNGIDEQVANKIYDEMLDFANYAFNKSHAAAYAVVAYQTAWLKYYYPVEYMAALMTSVIDNPSKVAEYIYASRQMGIQILPPDINNGEADFSVDEGNIRYGLSAIKSVGRPVVRAMLEERRTFGPYKNLEDFITRVSSKEGLNKRTIENLIKAGALDTLGGTRKQFMSIYIQIMDHVNQEKKYSMSGQMSLFDLVGEEEKADFQIRMPDVGEYSKENKLAFEKEVLGVYISGHPLEEHEERWRRMISATTADFQFDEELNRTKVHDGEKSVVGGMIVDKTVKYTKTNQVMAFLTLEDLLGTVEVVIFPRDYEKNRQWLEINEKVFISGRVSEEDEKASKLICEKVIPFERTKRELWIQFPDKETFLDEEQIVYGYLADSEGEDEVIIYCAKERAVKRLPKNRNIQINEQVLSRLMNHFGESRVKVVEKAIENHF